MTLLCVPIMVEDAESALEDARRAKLAGADMVEFRVDGVFHGEGDSEGEAVCLRLCAQSPLACVVTCRAASEGGAYTGDDAARVALYERLGTGDHPPRYLDFEHRVFQRSANLRQKIKLAVRHPEQLRETATASLILSLHDFEGRPASLLRDLSAMRSESAAAVIKIAFRARSVRDNLELFDLLGERDRPMIALGMGAYGLMSRVLAPKFGAFLTFAALRDESATAPGQPTVRELLDAYRFKAIGRETRVYGVIGWPVGHSLSPLAHNTGFDAVDFDAVYLPLPVAPEWAPFKATLHALADHPRLDFHGASVTIPHKEHLVRFAHESEGWRLDDWAQRTGAANTIVREAGGWLAANTDAPAVAACLRGALGALRGKRVLVLGAGGVARAAVAALAGEGAHVAVTNRTEGKARALVDAFADGALHSGGGVTRLAWGRRTLERFDACVHCTALGMAGGPDAGASALDEAHFARAPEGCVVFDTVYTPLDTPLLLAARARGLRTIDGASLFVKQAAVQFEMWTGAAAAEGLFDRVVRERLGG